MHAQKRTIFIAVLALASGCAPRGATDAQYLRVWFSRYAPVTKPGGYVCRELETGTWEMECLAEGEPSVTVRIRAPLPNLQAMFEEFRSTVKESEDDTRGISDFGMTVELGGPKRRETIVVTGTFSRIEEVFKRSTAIAGLQREFNEALPLAKEFWFRQMPIRPGGEVQEVPPGAAAKQRERTP